MSEYHYECIGGPKDGERYAPSPGQTCFKVAELPPPHVTPHPSNQDPTKDIGITIHIYDLKILDNGRLAWIYQK